jgi:ABC-type Mn2+/Zn2+ transport system ATPase subunit
MNGPAQAAGGKVGWNCRRPLLQISGLGVRFGDQWALRGVNLDVWRGESLAFIGPNGAGKSTLLRALLGLVPMAEGRIIRSHAAGLAGYVPQQLHSLAGLPLTVEEYMAISHPGGRAWFGGVPRRQRASVYLALERLKVASLGRQVIGTLSGGQLQRVMLAAAMLSEPELLLLDEPSSSIDRRGTQQTLELLQELTACLRLTLVFVSHDLFFVRQLATRVGCLNQNFCGLGPPEEMLSEEYLSRTYGGALAANQLNFYSIR